MLGRGTRHLELSWPRTAPLPVRRGGGRARRLASARRSTMIGLLPRATPISACCAVAFAISATLIRILEKVTVYLH